MGGTGAMPPAEFAERMRALAGLGDKALGREMAVYLAAEVLRQLGYADGADVLATVL